MKRRIFGRKAGTNTDFQLLMESDGASGSGSRIDPEKLREFELVNTHRAVKNLREKMIEGYVVFDSDPTHYKFTPEVDFVYPQNL